MKREELLEAIGCVSEDMLLQTEQTARRSGKTLRRVLLAAAVVAALAISVVASTDFWAGLVSTENSGASVSNLSTGMGTFVYTDEGIYHGVPGYIYLYDTQWNILKKYALADEYETPVYLFAAEDAIIYVNVTGVATENAGELDAPTREQHWGLRRLGKDGSGPETICPGISGTNVYVDGTRLYTTNGGTMLTQIDLLTMEKTELLENTHEYFVDDTYIYAVRSGEENCYFRSRKDEIAFEKINLDFDPNKIVADGEDLYLCRWIDPDLREGSNKAYQVSLIRDGMTLPLPVYSWFYQVLDGCVLYRESDPYVLKCYDISTGETTVLAEDVFEFSVLEDRYICVERFHGEPLFLDWYSVRK